MDVERLAEVVEKVKLAAIGKVRLQALSDECMLRIDCSRPAGGESERGGRVARAQTVARQK